MREKTVGYRGEALTLAEVNKRLEEARDRYCQVSRYIGETIIIIEAYKKDGETLMKDIDDLEWCKEALEYELGRENEREGSCKHSNL